MKQRLAKCKGCEKPLSENERYKYSNKTYCKDCYEKFSDEGEDYKTLIEYVCDIYNIQAPTGFMIKQIKDMKTEMNYPYSAMTYTLWYCKEILRFKFDAKYGLNFIQKYLFDARDYYISLENSKKKIEQLKDKEVKVKTIKNSSVIKNSNRRNYTVDLNEIIDM